MRIPEFLNRDDYLQNPILRRFLKDHRIKTETENKQCDPTEAFWNYVIKQQRRCQKSKIDQHYLIHKILSSAEV